MAVKKENYISIELDFAEEQLASWKQYVLDNPIDKLEDRMAFKQTAKGMISMVSATKESQIKCIQDTMEKYLKLLSVVDELREKEEKKKLQMRKGFETINDVLDS